MPPTTPRSIVSVALGLLLAGGLVVPAEGKSTGLSFEERVRAESAIQRVYYSHQIGALRPFTEVSSRPVLEERVRTYLRKSVALESLWDTRVTDGMLRSELRRMRRGTRMPERLREISAALNDDPTLLLECLARPVLVDRLTRNFFARDRSIHAESLRAAETLRQQLIDGLIDPMADRAGRRLVDLSNSEQDFDAWLARSGVRDRTIGSVVEERDRFTISAIVERSPDGARAAVFTVDKRAWEEWWAETGRSLKPNLPPVSGDGLDEATAPLDLPDASAAVPGCSADTWNNASLDDVPDAREGHTAVWTGSLMLVWGGSYTGTRAPLGSRYDPATDTWTPISTTNAPSPRTEHVAVWTGQVMIVWGGLDGIGRPRTGGRYDPGTDTWSATSIVDPPPSFQWQPIAVWTGNVMVVWGNGPFGVPTGARYDPVADTWSSVSASGSPPNSYAQTAVWTGSSVLIWGGLNCSSSCFATNLGLAYDPVGDTWSTLSSLNAPAGRLGHSAVWTGREMIIWGGQPNDYVGVQTGARYDPSTDRWTPTDTTNAPSARYGHTAVWTGSQMIVWGSESMTDTGGRYNPVSDKWTPTSVAGAPAGRRHHTAVWSGDRMIVWGGGSTKGGSNAAFSSGGRYDPQHDAWTPTSMAGAPSGRDSQTGVWTGSLLIVWGGRSPDSPFLDTGARYDPATDAWAPTAMSGAPSARRGHTAVWIGQEMLVWGGLDAAGSLATGRRYDPLADVWRTISDVNAPSARSVHTAVWTGRYMIVWGGGALLNSGGRYDPETDTWAPTSITGAPAGRIAHSAVWSGSQMIVWGGQASGTLLNTGGRYDPDANTWSPTSLTGAPTSRWGHSAVWTGRTMIVWGGITFTGTCFCDRATNTGAGYDPVANTWSSTGMGNAPSTRAGPTAVWTGDVMIVWGGTHYAPVPGPVSTGGRYHVDSGSWAPVSMVDAPTARFGHTAVWTGENMLIWGGSNMTSGGRYCPGDVPVYYRDIDGDAHGDANAPYVTYSPPPGYVSNGDDCNDQDSTWWSTPSEARDLVVPDSTTLRWSPPSSPGGLIVYFDALVALNPADFVVGAACVVSDITDLTCSEPATPPVGRASFYLVRAGNRCPQGESPLGYASDGTPLTGRPCP